MEAKTSQHGPCDGIKRATKNRGFLDERTEAAVIVGTRQINHSWQVRQEVTEFLLHLLPTKFIIGMFQVVVCDQIGAACQLSATWQFPHKVEGTAASRRLVGAGGSRGRGGRRGRAGAPARRRGRRRWRLSWSEAERAWWWWWVSLSSEQRLDRKSVV